MVNNMLLNATVHPAPASAPAPAKAAKVKAAPASAPNDTLAKRLGERVSDDFFLSLLKAVKSTGEKSEAAVQRVFLAAWRDLACSHSLKRLNLAFEAMEGNPFKTQFSMAIRTLAGMGKRNSDATSDKLARTGINPLIYDAKAQAFIWAYDSRQARSVKKQIEENFRNFATVHFRTVKLESAGKKLVTWSEIDAFRKRLSSAKNQGRIYEPDLNKITELLNELERISAKN